ncbi:ABC transporter permease subunit [Okibacterium endophyticum]
MTATLVSGTRARGESSPVAHLSFAGVLNSEWIKLRTLRSTMWSFALIVLVALALGITMAATFGDPLSAQAPEDVRVSITVTIVIASTVLAQLIAAVLGALTISGEYSTGMIRSTLAAVPTRLPALFAKAIVLGATTFVVGIIGTTLTFFATLGLRADKGMDVALTNPDVYMPMLGAAAYIALVAVFALGLGALIRSSAGAIAAAIGLILVLPLVLGLIPADWASDTAPYLLLNAGNELIGLSSSDEPRGTWELMGIIIAWPVATMFAGTIALARRDA